MNKDMIINLVLIAIMVILLITYTIYALIDEKEKIKYYKSVILYETNWDKYNEMVQKQKKILLKKKNN